MKTQNNTALKIGLACALGALIGTMISLKINNYFWWVGTLAGLLTGYVSYEFPRLIKSVPEAWQKTRASVNTDFKDVKVTFFKIPAKEERKEFWLIGSALLIAIININAGVFYLEYFDELVKGVRPLLQSLLIISFLFFWMLVAVSACAAFIGGIVLFFGFFLVIEDKLQDEKFILTIDDERISIKTLTKIVKYGSFIVLTPLCLYFALKYIKKGIYYCVRFIGKFFKNLFLLVHSEARLICGVDAGLGSLIGYYYESPIIGALCGAVFGIVNYYVVSIKILKLEPKF